MTKQDAFNRVYNHYIVEGNLCSYSESKTGYEIKYESKRKGRKVVCALRLFVPNKYWRPTFEDKMPACFVFENPQYFNLDDMEDSLGFFIELGVCHDESGHLDEVIEKSNLIDYLTSFANKYNLVIQEPST